ncbi:BolA family transcriptional regulator, partial [Xanthomonas oryzae pv. oryzae]
AFAPGEAGSPGSEQVVPPLDRLPLS